MKFNNVNKVLLIIICILIVIFLIEIFYVDIKLTNFKNNIKKPSRYYERKVELQFEREKKSLLDEHIEKKYLATGSNKFERIYNNKQNSIKDLILELAYESKFSNWQVDVKVEEFTKFILLIYTKYDGSINEFPNIVNYIKPIIIYSYPYLSSIAIFDTKHRCKLFFEDKLIKSIYYDSFDYNDLISKAEEMGMMCKRYNSIEVDFEEYYNHIYIPTIIYSENNSVESLFLMDTGATTTIISLELARITGDENLSELPSESFHTANGTITCPLVYRTFSISRLTYDGMIGVNENDDYNILGMDFLKDKNFYIDNNVKKVYFWYK